MAETGTALSVVEAQQNIVGGTLVGATGAGVLAETPSDSTSQILEQIRDIQIQTLRAVRSVADGIMAMVDMDKLQDRRAREDKTEDDKENLGPDGATPVKIAPPEGAEEGGGGKGIFGAILGAFGGMAFLKKLFAPFIAIFGKNGMLVKLFGRFGPLGALILGFTLVYKYSDEISKALSPALDQLKVLGEKLKPVTDFLLEVGDFLIKGLLEGIGNALKYVIDAVTRVVDGFTMLFDGDIMGGIKEIFGGLFDFVLAIPKAVLETVTTILTPLAEMVGGFFTDLYNNIVTYVTDTITNIKNFFLDLANNVLTFFSDAYNTVKTTITDAVQGAFDFIADIFNSISDFMSEAYQKAKNFVTSLPDRILGFISNMFSPIIDFFNAIGNRIKTTINGVIDALPLPDFVKDKIKFDVEPTQEELDNAEKSFEKLEAPEVGSANMNLDDAYFAAIDKNKEAIMKFMEETGTRLDLKGSRFHTESRGEPTLRFEESDGTATVFSAKSFDDGPADEIKIVKGYQASKIASSPNIDANNVDIEDVGNNSGMMVVNNNNYNTSNSSVNNQTDVHSGKLDTGIDSYFDKVAFNARGYS